MSEVLHSLYACLVEPRPPSVNHLYFTGPHGRRVLSKAGVAFKTAMQARVVEECMTLPWKQAIEAIYVGGGWSRLVICIHMPLLNGSWEPGSHTEKGNPRSPYKKVDGSSYMKVIEDAVVEGTGIDDSSNLTTTIHKIPSKDYLVEIFFEVLSRRAVWHQS